MAEIIVFVIFIFYSLTALGIACYLTQFFETIDIVASRVIVILSTLWIVAVPVIFISSMLSEKVNETANKTIKALRK